MKVFENAVRIAAGFAGFIAGLYGGWTDGMRVLVIFMVVDYLLGCTCALAGRSPHTESGHFWSRVAFLGILKKIGIMALVLVAIQLDKAVSPGESMFTTATTFFYIANEGLSIIENAGLLGVPLPKKLKQALELLRDENDGEDHGDREGE